MIIQLNRSNFAEVTIVLHTVVESCNGCTTDSNAVNGSTGQVINLSARSDSYRRAVSGIQSDSSVSTVDSYSRAVFTINGNGAVCTFSGTVFTGFFTKGNRIAQAYGEFATGRISRSRDVAITGDLNRLANVLLNSGAAVVGQAEAARCVFTGTISKSIHRIAYGLQLIFRSCTAAYDIRTRHIPFGVIQTSYIAARLSSSTGGNFRLITNGSVAGCYGIQPGNVFRQANRQFGIVIVLFGNDANVVVGR